MTSKKVVRDAGWLKITQNDEENDGTVQVKRQSRMNKIYGKELVRMTQTKRNLLCQKIDESNVHENIRTY